jgi:fucose 4-O-acetylase-like acetyltransferase
MEARDERDIWIDALRGIAIVLVVAGHALRGVETAGISTGALFGLLDVRFYAVHVQLLFFVSGLVVVRSLQRRGARPFAGSRVSVLLVPMILWTYVFLGVKLLAGPYQNQPVSWDVLLTSPVPGQLHLWFLWALFLMHLLVAALWALVPARRRTAAATGLFVASLAGTVVPLPAEVEVWAGMTIRFLPFFALGILLGLEGVGSRRGRGVSLVAAAVALGAFVFAPQIRAFSGSFLLPSLLACLGAYFSASLLLSRTALMRVLGYLGASAMAIYVLHTIFSAGLREALLAAGLTAPGPHLLLGIAAGVALPLIVREACLRFRVARPLAIA